MELCFHCPHTFHGTGTSIFFLQPGYMTQHVSKCYFIIRNICQFFLSCAICKYKTVRFLSLHDGWLNNNGSFNDNWKWWNIVRWWVVLIQSEVKVSEAWSVTIIGEWCKMTATKCTSIVLKEMRTMYHTQTSGKTHQITWHIKYLQFPAWSRVMTCWG